MEGLQSSNNIDNGPSDDTSWSTETNFMTNFRLHAFDPVETDYMLQQVKKVAVKSCELDLIPAKVLIKHTSSLAESIKDIISTSLLLREVSKNLRDAILWLLLKKANLNLVFTNYRPVSNLSYILKMIERAVSDQIQVVAERSGNLEPLQSAYRVGHSTKTALLKVKSDFLKAIDKDEAVCLVMLDLSTDFDTVSHELLLNRLKFRFGICDTALAWIKSYLSDRTQSVSIDDGNGITVTSDKAWLSCGVPQGQFLALSYLPSIWVPGVISVELMTFYSTHMPMIHKIILASNLNKISLKTNANISWKHVSLKSGNGWKQTCLN